MRDALKTRWSDMAEKMLTLAEEFPEEKYDFRPAAESRTFADQLRHVAFWNLYVSQVLRHEKADGDANELSPTAFATKATVVDALRNSFDGVSSQLTNGSDATDLNQVVAFIEHNGEHYGQLVVYCRLNGVVPPASR